MPQPSCCFSINLLNRMLDGLTKFRCVRICLRDSLPLPVRGWPERCGGLSLLTVVGFARRRLPISFFMRAPPRSTPCISTRSSRRAVDDAPSRVYVRCARSRALPLDPHTSLWLETCALWPARVAPSATGGCFCIFGFEPRDHGIQPRVHGHGIQPRDRRFARTHALALRPVASPPSSPPPRSPPPCLRQADAGERATVADTIAQRHRRAPSPSADAVPWPRARRKDARWFLRVS